MVASKNVPQAAGRKAHLHLRARIIFDRGDRIASRRQTLPAIPLLCDLE